MNMGYHYDGKHSSGIKLKLIHVYHPPLTKGQSVIKGRQPCFMLCSQEGALITLVNAKIWESAIYLKKKSEKLESSKKKK